MNKFERTWVAALEGAETWDDVPRLDVSAAAAADPSLAVPRLKQSLLSEDPRERRLAAATLEDVNARGSTIAEATRRALEMYPADEATAWVLSSLQASGDESDIELVAHFARHEDPDVRDVAASVLSALGWPSRASEAITALILLAGDSESEVAFSALWELGEWWQQGFRSREVEAVLERGRDNVDVRVRNVVEQALGRSV